MAADCKLELKGVAKRFGTKEVLRDVSIAVPPASSFVLIGGSGTGKSVTLRCALGLTTPDSGQVFVDGQDVTSLSRSSRDAVNRKFGMLFQNAALFDSLTVQDNVAFPLIHGRRLPRAASRRRAAAALESVGLGADVLKLRPAELSGGMRKRVGLARAVVAEPEILFFDEPTTGLDPIMSDVINELIVRCGRDLGAAAVTITHDLTSARKIGDTVGMIHEGRIIWTGPIDTLDASGDAHVDQFVNGRAEGPIKVSVRR